MDSKAKGRVRWLMCPTCGWSSCYSPLKSISNFLGANMSLQKPERFSTAFEEYEVASILGEGGSGRVFLTSNKKGGIFAIKCIFPKLVSTIRNSRFKNELNFLLKNTHPNILSVVDYGFLIIAKEKIPFYVMPHYPTTLRNLIISGLSPERSFEYFLKILDGIEEAHRRSIWHRDIKPENILVDPSKSRIVIADFGIAHFSEEELYTTVQTQKSERLANFQYAAPEQRKRGSDVDQRADIYSLGLILNEMLTGETPSGSRYKQVSDITPEYSYLDDVIEKMICQFPGDRLFSINEIKLELTIAQQTGLSSKLVTINHSIDPDIKKDLLKYRAEVDCVGRVEDIESNTVFSISAGLSYSILIPPAEKQKVFIIVSEIHPNWGTTRKCVYLYTIMLFLLIKDHIKKLDLVVIDNEYRGYEPVIKGLLMQLLRDLGLKIKKDQIILKNLNRSSLACQMAVRVFRGIAEPDQIISSKQISDLIK